MAAVVYILCALVAGACALLLLRGYSRTQARLLLWSGLCFAGLTISHLLVFIDLVMVPEIDLLLLRRIATLASVSFLVFGLTWDAR